MTKDEIAKKEIIAKAQELFVRFGEKKTTMDDIAHACGKAKSTIYHYFKNKEEILDKVIKAEITNLRQEVKSKVDNAKTLKEKIKTYILSFHTGLVDRINLSRSINIDLKNEDRSYASNIDYPGITRKFIDFEKQYITRLLEDAYDSGEYNKIQREDLQHFSETIIVAYLGVVNYSIENIKYLEEREKFERSVNITFDQIFS